MTTLSDKKALSKELADEKKRRSEKLLEALEAGRRSGVSGARQLGLRRVRVRMRVRGGVRVGGVRAPRGVEPRDSASVGDA
jgi:hypothetical protein